MEFQTPKYIFSPWIKIQKILVISRYFNSEFFKKLTHNFAYNILYSNASAAFDYYVEYLNMVSTLCVNNSDIRERVANKYITTFDTWHTFTASNLHMWYN